MKILNAHFHPANSHADGLSLVLARVYCDARGLSVEPVQSALENTRPMLELRWFLEHARPHTYESLLDWNTGAWTFDAPLGEQ